MAVLKTSLKDGLNNISSVIFTVLSLDRRPEGALFRGSSGTVTVGTAQVILSQRYYSY